MEGGEAVEEKWGRKGIVLTGERVGGDVVLSTVPDT